ncbi:MAG: site-2 protease family protein [Limnochordaceae bacterium]|nr:site-2 protease family protein [Limnochordaceae bacterium]
MTLNGIVAFVLVFGTIVLVHELGHFLVAKAVGVMVRDFSIGFGPALVRWRRRGTYYSLRLLPLGGFVRLEGMENPAESPPADQGEPPLAPSDPRRFTNRPMWQRVLTIAAGPAMNFVLAGVLLAYFFVPPVVQGIEPGGPAAVAGIEPGDRIVRIGDLHTPTGARVQRAVLTAPEGARLPVWIERDGRIRQVVVEVARQDGRGYIGIRMGGARPWPQALYGGFVQMVDSTGDIVRIIARMLGGREPVQVAGPVGIFSMVQEAAQQGPANLIGLAAILNINLGLINLLPLPVLDGGWLLFMGIEWIRRRPLEPQLQSLAQMVGLMLLIGLMLLATYFDLLRG